MIKQTVVVLSDNSTVIIEQTTLCKISAVLCYEDQYFTWILVFIGWIIAGFIAYWQLKRSEKSNKKNTHNDWVKDFKEKSSSIENESLKFWLKKTTPQEDLLYFTMAQRELKELTTIAMDIKKLSGIEYPQRLFINLRRDLTNDRELSSKPLETNHQKIQSIIDSFAKLRNIYTKRN
ncbi:hypothetical protein [Vibrio cholerae]|uniref:hypothetical protein n=1 Tax=Vibrio cholerae TaxID=666 RepID=UPI001D85BF12|nr:hypothetical protein [Vibrio cholerae]EGR1040971.1 hypothetical protein [Vibrio cholerae]EGR2016757.1 hypothetical protein [Vibrio cholerae]EGR2444973.1 hypothetical protein [Vibrio cholerae]MCD1244983.1 hypothetical protein [Vibrio cholerae]GHW35197.1 hypothetical protein VCSRO56_1152 [Vibrio cholerae]